MAKQRQASIQMPPATPTPIPALAPVESVDDAAMAGVTFAAGVVGETVVKVVTVGGTAVEDALEGDDEDEDDVVDAVELDGEAVVVEGDVGAEFVNGEGTAVGLMYSGVRGCTGYDVSCAITLGVSATCASVYNPAAC